MLSQEVADLEEPKDFVLSYNRNDTMVKLSLILSGETVGISNTGEVFTEEDLDFSWGRTVEDLPLSKAYVNDMGTWAYTIKSPVIRNTEEIATLYIEYIYDSFDEVLPDQFYNKEAKLCLMDVGSQRLVLKPKTMGERDISLEDFYIANKILESNIQENVAENIKNGKNVMFYHDIQNEDSLIYMWSVNQGTEYMIGYVPVRAIQREGNAVNQNIIIVVIVMMVTFSGCCAFYLFLEKQNDKIRRDRESERELYNTQLKEALQAAQVANNSKTTFLSNMSHDIRTPMNAILGFAALIARDVSNQEQVREYKKKLLLPANIY